MGKEACFGIFIYFLLFANFNLFAEETTPTKSLAELGNYSVVGGSVKNHKKTLQLVSFECGTFAFLYSSPKKDLKILGKTFSQEDLTKLQNLEKNFLYYVQYNLEKPEPIIHLLPVFMGSCALGWATGSLVWPIFITSPITIALDVALLPVTSTVFGVSSLVHHVRRTHIEEALKILMAESHSGKTKNLSSFDFDTVLEIAERLSVL
jgi:hypothetical protein